MKPTKKTNYNYIFLIVIFVGAMIFAIINNATGKKSTTSQSETTKEVKPQASSSCASYFNESSRILYYLNDSTYRVYIWSKNTDKTGYKLADTKITVFDGKCNIAAILDNDPSELSLLGNSVSSVELNSGTLIIKYNVNPNSSTVRRITLPSVQDLYFSEICNPDNPTECTHTRQTSYYSEDRLQYKGSGYTFEFPHYLVLKEQSGDETKYEKGFVSEALLVNYNCTETCKELEEKTVFSMRVYDEKPTEEVYKEKNGLFYILNGDQSDIYKEIVDTLEFK